MRYNFDALNPTLAQVNMAPRKKLALAKAMLWESVLKPLVDEGEPFAKTMLNVAERTVDDVSSGLRKMENPEPLATAMIRGLRAVITCISPGHRLADLELPALMDKFYKDGDDNALVDVRIIFHASRNSFYKDLQLDCVKNQARYEGSYFMVEEMSEELQGVVALEDPSVDDVLIELIRKRNSTEWAVRKGDTLRLDMLIQKKLEERCSIIRKEVEGNPDAIAMAVSFSQLTKKHWTTMTSDHKNIDNFHAWVKQMVDNQHKENLWHQLLEDLEKNELARVSDLAKQCGTDLRQRKRI